MTNDRRESPRMQIKDIIGALIVGAISTVGSVMILTARLDERSAATSTQQSEIKTLIGKVSEQQSDLGQRVARIEGTLSEKAKK